MHDVESAGEPVLVGRGFYWQELKVGQRFRTFKRTVTETDLVNFVSVTGMVESIFVDTEFKGGAIQGRPAPAALIYSLIEGLIIQSMIQGTGLALLETSHRIIAPMLVGDTFGATVELIELKPTSKSGRAVTTWAIEVSNQRGETVMTYIAKRLLAGRGEPRHAS